MTLYKDNHIVQLGVETAWGCDAAPTIKLMGVEDFEITPIRETEQVKVLDGRFSPSNVALRTKTGGEATLTGLLTYEDSGLWFDSLFGAVNDTDIPGCTSNSDGVYTRVYPAPLACYTTDEVGSVPTYTLPYGPACSNVSTNAVSLISGVAKTVRISAESGGVSRIEVDFLGQTVEEDELAVSTDAPDRTVNYVMGSQWSVYVDPDTDAVGTTVLSNLAFKFDAEIMTNREPNYHLGALTPSGYRDAEWEGTLNLTLELSSDYAGAYLTSALSDTVMRKAIRLKATTGSAATLKTVQIDFGGVLLEAPTLWTDQDGMVTVEMAFKGIYQSTLTNWLKITTQNAAADNQALA